MYRADFFDPATAESLLARIDRLRPDAGHSLRVYDDKLYTATYRDGTDSNYLNVWDGSVSYRFGPGFHLTGAVPGTSQLPNLYDVLRYDGDLVVCGEFDHAGGRPIEGIACWNGTRWDSLGGGGFGTGWVGAVEFPSGGLAPSSPARPWFAPNPAEGSTAWTATPRPDGVRLVDAGGRVLRTWSPVPERLDLGGLAPGVYRLAWDTPEGPVSAALLLR